MALHVFLLCFVRRYQSALQLSATRDSLRFLRRVSLQGCGQSQGAVAYQGSGSGEWWRMQDVLLQSSRARFNDLKATRHETAPAVASHSGYAHPERCESRRLTLGQMPVALHPWYCVRSQERRIRKPPSWIIHHTSIVLRGPGVRQQSESEADLPLSRKVGLAIKLRPGCLSD